MNRPLFILFSLALAACGEQSDNSFFSDSAINICSSTDIHEIQVPVNYEDSKSKSLTLKYEQIGSPKINVPVVVFIPGGPGQTSIGGGRNEIPDGYSVVNIDLRGIGCNKSVNSSKDDEFYNPEFIANDVVRILQDLNSNQIVLYGLSYGTSLATMVARDFEKTSPGKLRLLVLEGVLGRHFMDKAELYKGYSDNWNAVYLSLPQKVKATLANSNLPLGINREFWGSFVSKMLMLGHNRDGSVLAKYLRMINTADEPVLKEMVNQMGIPDQEDTSVQRLYKLVSCTQISDGIVTRKDDGAEFILKRSTLETVVEPLCGDLHLRSYKYDSAKYEIATPVVYFSGSLDPATPPWQADYHYDHIKSHRIKVRVKSAGHNPLLFNLSDCRESVWRSLLDDPTSLSMALATCKQTSEIIEK